MESGFVFDIQRFSVHDGPGIRTTVFLGGCPLRCKWCHNPEGTTATAKLLYNCINCLKCGKCAEVCSVHSVTNNKHKIDRIKCITCGKCVDSCPADALSISGKPMPSKNVFNAVMRDFPFYGDTGGVTFSGGEPLLQPYFVAECMKLCRSAGITTAVDTCGCVLWKNIDAVLPFTNYFLYDIKAITDSIHIKYTGKSNKIILDNCQNLSEIGVALSIRIPVINGFNSEDNEIENIAKFISGLKTMPLSVTLIQYHSLGHEKYALFGMEPPTEQNFYVTPCDMKRYRNIFNKYGIRVT